MTNAINYALLNPYSEHKNDLCFREVYELVYTKDGHTFSLIIGIDKDENLDKSTRILSLEEIVLELGQLYLNAKCTEVKKSYPNREMLIS